DQEAAMLLRTFIMSADGKALLRRYGFFLPGEGRMDWTAIGLSLRLASCTTLILCALGLPLAYWLAVSKWRGKFLLEAVVALPLVLPPTVLGFYILLAIGPHSPLGQGYTALTGGRLPFSFAGLLLASVLYSLPFAIRPFLAAFAGID